MDPVYKQRFTAALLSEAAARYGVAPAALRALDGFESFIYEYERDGQGYILRIGHAHRRSEALIRGEVDWINYLAAHIEPQAPFGVAQAVNSAKGNLVEALPDGEGEHFLAVSFRKAPGEAVRQNTFTPELIETYGRMLGCMHALARAYQPGDPAGARMHWDDPILLDVARELPPTEALAARRYAELRAALRRLPRNDPAAYGLIHQDAHGGNIFVENGMHLTLFDFDDCCYSWYANDIAIVLFYAVMWKPDPAAYTGMFMRHFLNGYRQENELDPAWLRLIPDFLKLREIELYAVIHRSFDVTHLTDRWVAGYMDGRKARIENGVPYLDFDFEKLSGEIK